MKRSGIKRRRPRVDPQEQRIRDSARGEDCTLRFDLVCRNDTSTTVYCHSNRLIDGKGMGLKAKIGCYGCSNCHDVLDDRRPRIGMTRDEMLEIFDRACAETRAILIRKGLIHE